MNILFKIGFNGEDLMRRIQGFQIVLQQEWIDKKFDPEASFHSEGTA